VNPAKEVLFLNEIEEVIELMNKEQFDSIVIPMMGRLCACMRSGHY